MVGWRSPRGENRGENGSGASGGVGGVGGAPEEALPEAEQHGLARCRHALERGRRVRGRVVASGDHGLLLDVHGAVGHVPAADATDRPATRGLRAASPGRWDGWVVAVGDDLVHLAARRPSDSGSRRAEVLTTGRSGLLVRLADEGSLAVVPWEELSWQPLLEPPRVEPGTVISGTVVGITLDGPVLSPRSLVPSPWPAIALALPPGATVRARVETIPGDQALLRTTVPPRAAAVVAADELPHGTAPGATLTARVDEVNPLAGLLALAELSGTSPSSRAPRLAPAGSTPEPPAPAPGA